MKRVIGLAIGAVAIVALSGCNPVNNPYHQNEEGRAYIYTSNLENGQGFKISGWDTKANKSVDLCFDGYNNFVYGRGGTYYEGSYAIDDARDIVFKDSTDGGSYILYTDGEIIEGITYNFGSTLPHNNIKVDTINYSNNISSCGSDGKKLRTFSTIGPDTKTNTL